MPANRTRLIILCAATLLNLPAPAEQNQTLLATPTTVAWGFYSAKATPALTIHSGDTVTIQTLSTCCPPERLKSLRIDPCDIPSYVDDISTKAPTSERGTGGHVFPGPAAISEAEPGAVLEVLIQESNIHVTWA